MQDETELAESKPTRDGTLEKPTSIKTMAYESSLIGEYTRLLLLLSIGPLAIGFANHSLKNQTGFLYLAACLIVLSTLVISSGYQTIRIGALGLMSANVFSCAISPSDISGIKDSGLPEWSVLLLLFCLILAIIFETAAWIKSNPQEVVIKTLAWCLLLIPAIVYVLAAPIFDSIWATLEGDEKNLALRNPNWGVTNEAAFRSAKLFVFCIFAYLGACLGSFLNVAAYCIPRGESVGLRDSQCPDCNSKISRIDNLPIFSYINLGGKCRSCAGQIPARYLIVEIVAALIFGSLFLFELVTGCSNVPSMTILHQGILWIILYPKWPVIGIYFFHCFLMCAVLVLAIMERDNQQLKPTFAISTGLAFLISAATYLPIQPIPLFAHLPEGLSIELKPWIEQLLKLLVGGTVGFLIGRCLGISFSAKNLPMLTFAFLLTGLALGWQALLQVSVIFGVAATIYRYLPHNPTRSGCRLTTLFLVAIAIHHPFWKTVADWW
ncbi:MAG: prepilin peptidase [Mariniblastus sp.]|nr:prepilin peptidase [Mariniblastus sp.]